MHAYETLCMQRCSCQHKLQQLTYTRHAYAPLHAPLLAAIISVTLCLLQLGTYKSVTPLHV